MESSGFEDAHMKVSREQVAEHRTRILDAAARLFRLRGFDEVMVAEVMKDAGLTHGAFYRYFPSKEALSAEAIRHALPPAPDEGCNVEQTDHCAIGKFSPIASIVFG
jgi:TetR/AcrR family transcriptional repressor of nem operon